MKNLRKPYPSDRFVTRQALTGITKIVPFFHRIKLSSSLLYDDIDDIFPDSIKQPGNSGDIASTKTGKKYQKMGWLCAKNKRVQYAHFTGYEVVSKVVTSPCLGEC